ncbi:hypothetical protein [Metabacillus sp. RGM 3146]|uniref:hypothetical protein n=1 Tax=Metabacillus sp. RGM 3146 TaxID=3401092 RepID=UPI003B999B42
MSYAPKKMLLTLNFSCRTLDLAGTLRKDALKQVTMRDESIYEQQHSLRKQPKETIMSMSNHLVPITLLIIMNKT